MALRENLKDLAASVALATSSAPDNYASWSSWTYETHMVDLKELWMAIRPQLKRDLDRAEWVDAKLQEMYMAFDAGEKERGRDAAWALYNAELTKLK